MKSGKNKNICEHYIQFLGHAPSKITLNPMIPKNNKLNTSILTNTCIIKLERKKNYLKDANNKKQNLPKAYCCHPPSSKA